MKYVTADKVKTDSLTNTSNTDIVPIKYATLEVSNQCTDLQKQKKNTLEYFCQKI